MSDSRIEIEIDAVDNASEVFADVASTMAGSLGVVSSAEEEVAGTLTKVSEAQAEVTETTAKIAISFKDLTIGVAGAATASFGLYNAYDNVRDMSVQVDRANVTAKASLNSLEDAQRKYADTVAKYGSSSEQAQAAQADLQLAQERYNVALERADMLQGNYNETMVRSAISVLPAVITLVASLSSIHQILTTSTIAGTAAETAFSWAKMFAIAPTATLTAAIATLNAVLLANPIILVVAALAALVGGLVYAYNTFKPFKDAIDAVGKALMEALKPAIDVIYGALEWLWNNILVPLGKYLLNNLIGAIQAVAGAIKWLSDGIGAITGWLGDQWAKLTGTWTDRVQKSMDEQLGAVQKGLESQSAAVNKKYDEMTTTVEKAYADQTQAALDSWNKRLSTEVTGWEKVVRTANDNYDKLVDEARSRMEDQIEVVNDGYSTQLDDVKDAYGAQLDAINEFYYNVIATTQDKLDGVKSAREDDLNALELSYLLQKEAIERGVADGTMARAEGQAKMESLDRAYNDRRSSISDDYRIRELEAETANKVNIATAEADRKSALEKAAKDETDMEVYLLNDRNTKLANAQKLGNAEIAAINEERNGIIAEIETDRERIETEHSAKLAEIFRNRESELTKITQNAVNERNRIVEEANEKLGYTSRYITSIPVPAPTAPNEYQNTNPFTGQAFSIPFMQHGGIVLEPTLALIGEAGPEVVAPLSSIEIPAAGNRTQYNTLYITIQIGNISKEVKMEEVTDAAIEGVVKAIDRRL